MHHLHENPTTLEMYLFCRRLNIFDRKFSFIIYLFSFHFHLCPHFFKNVLFGSRNWTLCVNQTLMCLRKTVILLTLWCWQFKDVGCRIMLVTFLSKVSKLSPTSVANIDVARRVFPDATDRFQANLPVHFSLFKLKIVLHHRGINNDIIFR